NPRRAPEPIELNNGHVDLVPAGARLAGRHQRINYHVDLEPIEADALFFAGTPETVDLRAASIYRTEGGGYRMGGPAPQVLRYDAYSVLEDPPERALAIQPAPVLPLAARNQLLQLPPLDRRIAELARSFTANALTDAERARAVERRLRVDYGYTLELPERRVRDPLANFLFMRKKGHCEYVASAMAVMLRSLGIPARLATGFQSWIYNSVSDLWLVRASDAHSWVDAWE